MIVGYLEAQTGGSNYSVTCGRPSRDCTLWYDRVQYVMLGYVKVESSAASDTSGLSRGEGEWKMVDDMVRKKEREKEKERDRDRETEREKDREREREREEGERRLNLMGVETK